MSFIKKGLKKVWGFVKKHWVKIVMVAAIAFTAGIATIGVAGFQAALATGNIFTAVGSTMWAGVTGIGASMGIGSGPGVGAAWGGGQAGMGYGVAATAPAGGSIVSTGAGMSVNLPGAAAGITTAPAAGSSIVPALVQGGMTLGGAFITARSNAEAAETTPLASWGYNIGQGQEADEAELARMAMKESGAEGADSAQDAAQEAQAGAIESIASPVDQVVNTAVPNQQYGAGADPTGLMNAANPQTPGAGEQPGVIDQPGSGLPSLMPDISSNLLSGRVV